MISPLDEAALILLAIFFLFGAGRLPQVTSVLGAGLGKVRQIVNREDEPDE